MKSIVVLLGICSLATAALAHQAQSLQPGLQRQPLTLHLAVDDAPTWDEVVHQFSDQLQAAYRLDGSAGDAFAEWIMDASDLHSVPADLLAAVINTESNFRTAAVSWADAVGPAQVIPRVWQSTCQGDLKAPANNIRCGALVLRHYYVRYCKEQSWSCALEYYHTGPGKMAMGDAYAQTRATYVGRIAGNLERLPGATTALL